MRPMQMTKAFFTTTFRAFNSTKEKASYDTSTPETFGLALEERRYFPVGLAYVFASMEWVIVGLEWISWALSLLALIGTCYFLHGILDTKWCMCKCLVSTQFITFIMNSVTFLLALHLIALWQAGIEVPGSKNRESKHSPVVSTTYPRSIAYFRASS
ncbi:hypothetical protein Pelo_6190 [Pelomyxa schiedti]|nr:hypothetical protein Pelo_6190 [Pelomyxa schiedti]